MTAAVGAPADAATGGLAAGISFGTVANLMKGKRKKIYSCHTRSPIKNTPKPGRFSGSGQLPSNKQIDYVPQCRFRIRTENIHGFQLLFFHHN